MKCSPTDMARWTVCWRNPYTTPPGPRVLGAVLVKRGERCPPEIEALAVPGSGYCLSWELVTQQPVRRWSREARAKVRRRNLQRRLETKVPLFARMLFEQKLARRPDYFAGDYS